MIAPAPAYRKFDAAQNEDGRTADRRRAAPLVALPSFDPVFDLEGAFFPAWMLCLLGGILLTAALRPLVARSGLEPHLGPLALVYSSLALLISFAAWLTFFDT